MTRLRAKEADVLAVVDEVLATGERCPTTNQLETILRKRGFFGLPARLKLPELARAGHLKIEIYRLNYRVIERHGRRSKEPPNNSGSPHRIIKEFNKANEKEPPTLEQRQAALKLPTYT